MAFPDSPDENDPLAAREQEVLAELAGANADEPLTVEVLRKDGIPVLQLRGELDGYTAGLFRERLDAALASQPRALVVDLTGAAYLDSSGLTLLLRAAGQMGGALHIVSPRQRITRLFQATGLTGRMKLHQTLPEALLYVAMG